VSLSHEIAPHVPFLRRFARALCGRQESGDAYVVALLDEAGGSRLLGGAGRQIAELVAADVLIIEEEPLVAMDLEDIATSLGHRICAVAPTRRDAVAAVKQNDHTWCSRISSSRAR
jgi:hypothetical protein